MLSLIIRDKSVLYSSYMPFIKSGGIFIPTNNAYKLGDVVLLILSLMEEAEKLSITGKVIWITPQCAEGNRVPGIGVQFQGKEGESVRQKIENCLAAILGSDHLTYTM